MVILSDTDHYTQGGDALWAWKTFLRGHQPVLMDYGLIDCFGPDAAALEGVPPFAVYEPARFAMGDTRHYAERVSLIDMEPRVDVASTRFALVNRGQEYLVLEPTGDGRPFTVELAARRYAGEWFDIGERRAIKAAPIEVAADGPIEFTAPFAERPAVLYLREDS